MREETIKVWRATEELCFLQLQRTNVTRQKWYRPNFLLKFKSTLSFLPAFRGLFL